MNSKILEYRPTRIALVFTLVAVMLHMFLSTKTIYLYSHPVLGVMGVVVGFIVMMWGWWLFKTSDLAICPTAETDALVTHNIYRYTRNPMYLGMIVMLGSLAVFIGTLPFYASVVIYFIVINSVFCPYEEAKLFSIFGSEYATYRNRVRRWI